MICNYGQFLEIQPAMGKKRRIELNRTFFHFNFVFKGDLVRDQNHLTIPSISSNQKIEIFWNQDHFEIKSGDQSSFLINGSKALHAILQKNDEIKIGYAILKILPTAKKQFVGDGDFIQNLEIMNQSDLPILIEGETGVGKTRLAKKLHLDSHRRHFVHVNLSALSQNLIESELFGHIRGSFTGAINDKQGAFDKADGGTLFLDEIDSLPRELQVKLLTFLDNKEFYPVGSVLPRKINCKLVFASGRDLSILVDRGYYRPDFYFRISSGFRVLLPSLRNKSLLIKKMIEDFEGKYSCSLEKKLKNFYLKYHWPGNHRQLIMHLQKKRALSPSGIIKLDEHDAVLLKLNQSFHGTILSTLEEQKRRYILYCYYLFNRNVQQTAEVLEVNRKTVSKYIEMINPKELNGYELIEPLHQS
jgi:transcriptional regulator with PAS, ATPase and Fis domain